MLHGLSILYSWDNLTAVYSQRHRVQHVFSFVYIVLCTIDVPKTVDSSVIWNCPNRKKKGCSHRRQDVQEVFVNLIKHVLYRKGQDFLDTQYLETLPFYQTFWYAMISNTNMKQPINWLSIFIRMSTLCTKMHCLCLVL